MRFSVVALAFLATSATAAYVNPKYLLEFPTCALNCAVHSDHAGCGHNDYKCECSNKQYQANVEACVKKACPNPADQAKAKKAKNDICSHV